MPQVSLSEKQLASPEVGEFWREEIDIAKKADETWLRNAKTVIDLYASEQGTDEIRSRTSIPASMNLVYSNAETMRPAMFQKMPAPKSHRRRLKSDPIGLAAAQMLEYIVRNQLDEQIAYDEVDEMIYDHLLAGRGVMRVCYRSEPGPHIPGEEVRVWPQAGPTPTFVTADGANQVPADRVRRDEASNQYLYQQPDQPSVGREWVEWKFVPYDQFLHKPCKRWKDVTWIAFKSTPTRRQAAKKFGKDVVKRMSFGQPRDDYANDNQIVREQYDRAEVWEIWDKASRKVFYIDGKAAPNAGALKTVDDPLGLRDFFPMPRPFFSLTRRPTTRAIPEYKIWQSQSRLINDLTSKIHGLTRVLRVKIMVMGSEADLLQKKLFGESDDSAEVIPVRDWSGFEQAGGIDRAIYFMPIDEIVQTLQATIEARESIKQEVYEITGVSDILRGASKASETATAQNIKRQFATLRIDERVRRLNNFLAEMVRLHAEIASELFSPQTLIEASGMDLSPEIAQEVVTLLRDDVRRRFKIDVETDSTIEPDQLESQQASIQFVQAFTQGVTAMAPMVQSGVIPFEIAKAIIMLGVRAFPGSRDVEDLLERMQPPPPPPQEPSEAEVKAQQQQVAHEHELRLADMKSRAQSNDQQAKLDHDSRERKMDRVADLLMAGMQNAA